VVQHDRVVLERTLRRLIYGCPDRLSDDSIADLEPLDRATDRRDLTGDVAAENRGIVEPWQSATSCRIQSSGLIAMAALRINISFAARCGRAVTPILSGCPGAFCQAA
jgi:hypothetical protein